MDDALVIRFAAKSVGIVHAIGLLPKDGVSLITSDGVKWNPLTSDSDALWLMSTLVVQNRLRVGIDGQGVTCYYNHDGVFVPYHWSYDNIEPTKAFRLCVTHAAAELSKLGQV